MSDWDWTQAVPEKNDSNTSIRMSKEEEKAREQRRQVRKRQKAARKVMYRNRKATIRRKGRR